MAEYSYPQDGKLHTRYTELKRCTIRGAAVVAQERLIEKEKRQGDHTMHFGSVRHEMWEQECKETGKTPECFLEPPCSFQMPVSHVEQEFICEPIPGIVLHSTPDFVSTETMTIADGKTTSGSLFNFVNDKQIVVYAFNLALNNIVIRNGVYLVELWNPQRTAIAGYGKVEQKFDMNDLRKVFNTWLKPRMLTLQEAVRQLEKQR